jgi:hypothetical protein
MTLFSRHLVPLGRPITQAVSCWLPTTATRVLSQARPCGQSGAGVGFVRVLRFPLPILIPTTAPHSSSIIQGWYNRPISGRRAKWTHSHTTRRNNLSHWSQCSRNLTSVDRHVYLDILWLDKVNLRLGRAWRLKALAGSENVPPSAIDSWQQQDH